MNVLIAGAGGQVGTALLRRKWPEGVTPCPVDRAAVDLTDPGALAALLAERAIAGVINAAAYTAVDRAETEIAEAFKGNAAVPAALAQATRALDLPLVHLSTDYVFDGTKAGPYRAGDPVAPIGIYGASKAAGEFAVRLGNPRSVVLRTAWVVSPYGNNFAKTMLRLGAERPLLRVVADQHGSPTIAADLADALAEILLRLAGEREAPTGVYHFANAGPTTWHGFAEAIFDAAAAFGRRRPDVAPIATADHPTLARRPANSLLDVAGLQAAFGITPAPWPQRLPDLVGAILAQAS